MQIKTILNYLLIPVRMAAIKKNIYIYICIINAGGDVKRRKSSYIVGGNENWYSHYGEQ